LLARSISIIKFLFVLAQLYVIQIQILFLVANNQDQVHAYISRMRNCQSKTIKIILRVRRGICEWTSK